MIEQTIFEFLKKHLDVPVVVAVPADRPDRFILFERTGGRVDEFRDLAEFAFQTWAQDVAGASLLADQLREVLPLLVTECDAASVTINGTYNYPDPASGQARYQTTATIITKWNHSF